MVSISEKLIVSLLFVGILYTTDATITAWTEPVIASLSGAPAAAYTFAENIATGTAGVSTQFAVNGEGAITFTLLTSGAPFSVATDGVLSLDTALDFELTTTYTIQVQAVDTTNPTTGTATITVTVTDVNVAPAFAQANYGVNIADGSTAGTTLTTVSATDQDTTDVITYSIIAGNSAGHFSIVDSTGVITVAQTLDASTTAAYTLQVKAVDDESPPQTGTTTIKVTVKSDSGSSGLLAGSRLVLMMSFLALLK